MTFSEKLRRASAGINKAKAGSSAGLGATTISNYISTGSIPRADIALKIARAVGVPLEWLIDEDLDWPPRPATGAAALSTAELVAELGRRMSGVGLKLLAELDRAEHVNWVEVARELLQMDPRTSRSKIPPLAKLPSQMGARASELRGYAPAAVISEVPPELTGQVQPGYAFDLLWLIERFNRLGQIPGYHVVLQLATLLALPDEQFVAENIEAFRNWAKHELAKLPAPAAENGSGRPPGDE